MVQVAVLLGLVAMATAPRKASHQSPNRWPWTVGAVGLAAWAVFLVVGRLRPGSPLVTALSYTIVDSAGMCCAAAMILALSLLVRGARGNSASTPTLLGLAWLAGAAVVLRAAALPDWLPILRQGVPVLLPLVVQLGAAVSIAILAGTVGVIRLRRLPAVSYRATGPRVEA